MNFYKEKIFWVFLKEFENLDFFVGDSFANQMVARSQKEHTSNPRLKNMLDVYIFDHKRNSLHVCEMFDFNFKDY
jgi:hypothetical protein